MEGKLTNDFDMLTTHSLAGMHDGASTLNSSGKS